MRRARSAGFRGRYGAGPAHLAGHLVALAIIAFAFDRIFSGGSVPELLVWFLGFVVAHDLILVPLYTGVDRVLGRLFARLSSSRRTGIPIVNHVRAPLLISGILLLIYAPLISGAADKNYLADSGHHLEHYFRNWLLITGASFLASTITYVLRVGRLRRERRKVMSIALRLPARPGE